MKRIRKRKPAIRRTRSKRAGVSLRGHAKRRVSTRSKGRRLRSRITRTGRALLVVDLQNDFCPGGALGVPEGDRIVPVVNRYVRHFARNGQTVFASRDWHPIHTSHFRDFGGTWPVHCIRSSPGAQFHPLLRLPKETVLLYKGMDSRQDGYSVFQAEDASGTGFLHLLRIRRIQELSVAGLATDYCVRETVLDALKQGFKVRLLVDAIKGVNLRQGDAEKAIKEMVRKGAKRTTLTDMED